MQVFKIDKNIYLGNELKSWGGTIAFSLALYFCFKLFLLVPQDKLLIGVAVIILLKFGDALAQYRVTEIRIDRQKNQLTFILKSPMSGQKVKRYELTQAESELKYNCALTRILLSPVTLKILLLPKDTFRINGRYGFSTKTLTSVDETLKSINGVIATT